MAFNNDQIIATIDSIRNDEDYQMPDSVRVKEIHEALQANKFAKNDNNDAARIANLGYYVERIARVLGINVNDDGSPRSIRQKQIIERGQQIPAGWSFGQWGLNKGGNRNPALGQMGGKENEFRDGIVYEQRSNFMDADTFNPENVVIKQGNYVLCENLPQLLDEMLDDIDKGFGWQELGANVIPNADGSGKYCTFEGLAQLLIEVAYNLSRVSEHTSQTHIVTMISQAVVYELLRATGQPLTAKTFQADIGGTEYANVPYPALASDAPTQIEQTGWILQTIAPILAAFSKQDLSEENKQDS